jgi:serine/threonine protein kinase
MNQPDYISPNTILSGRYVITSHLGGGGFGQTYLAEDKQLPGHPQCVVKQLKPQFTDPTALQIARRLFDTEANVLYKLGNHSHIPRLLAHFEENQEFFLVQEFIDGHSLDEELAPGKKLDEAEVISMIAEILEILAFVHEEGVIHRDIKPSNIIRWKHDGRLVLIDFGAVKQISTATSITKGQTTLTVAVGTPGYMPNEQSSGKPRRCSDVYAVGILAIQALTGLAPDQLQEDPHTGELVWHHQAQSSSNLKEVLDKMVCYDFRQRYASATEALQAVRSLSQAHLIQQKTIRTIPSTLHVPLSTTHVQPLSHKPSNLLDSKKILLTGGVVSMAVVVGVLVTKALYNQPLPQPNISPTTRLSPSLSNSSPTPKSSKSETLIPQSSAQGSETSQTSQLSPTTSDERQAISETPTAPIPKPSPVVPVSPAPEVKPSSQLPQGWQLIGSASTGERVYVDNSSISTSGGSTRFTYKIGSDLINATADCNNNRWYASGYGWYSPQSQATQDMLNYVCRF